MGGVRDGIWDAMSVRYRRDGVRESPVIASSSQLKSQALTVCQEPTAKGKWAYPTWGSSPANPAVSE